MASNINTLECMRFYVTHMCNSRCWFCDSHDNDFYKKIKPLSLDKAKLLIYQAHELGCNYIDFTGGEPTLNLHLPELIEYAHSLGITTEFTTNGINGINADGELSAHVLKCLKAADNINISLDSLQSDVYAKRRGVDKLPAVLSTINALPKDVKPTLMMAVSEENFAEISQILKFAYDRGMKVYLNPVFSYFDEKQKNLAVDYIEKLKKLFFEPASMIMLDFMELYRDLIAGKKHSCSACRQALTVAADGSVMLPCYHSQKRKFVAWNENLSEIVNSQEFKEYTNSAGAREECQDCMVSPYFGTSFIYRLDKYFMLSTLSVEMTKLKKKIYFSDVSLEINREKLNKILNEYFEVLRSLKVKEIDLLSKEMPKLYYAERQADGSYLTDVYREPVSEEKYLEDMSVNNCWYIKGLPHNIADRMQKEIFGNKDRIKEQPGIIEKAPEFYVRLWRFYTANRLRAENCKYVDEDRTWIKAYLEEIGALDILKLLGM